MLTTLAEKIAPLHTALLVIDMQNDFCDDEGASAKNGEDVRLIRVIVPTLRDLTVAARRAGVLVVFVRASHDEVTNSDAWLERRRGRAALSCTEGTWGADWYADLRPHAGDAVVTKHRYSAFINTPLDLILRSRGIRTIVPTGTATNVCVESTARDGHMLDYYVVLPEDAAVTTHRPAHDSTLYNIRTYFGDVVTSADLCEAWNHSAESGVTRAGAGGRSTERTQTRPHIRG
jgi:ureidoacrylate peracid hydrolase